MRPIEFERRVCDELRVAAGLRAGCGVVLAVSGGADSVAMLRAICERNTRDELGWRLHVAHLNHGLRGAEADADAAFVRTVSRHLGVACTVGRARLKLSKRGVEERARLARYRFLERVARRVGAATVVVAHQADDQAETVLHHVLRGSGLRGVGGMRPVRSLRRDGEIRLVRPMLRMRRADVRAYLSARGQAFRDDRTNDDESLTRNRIRKRVLPLLEAEVGRNARQALTRLAEAARWTQDFVEEASERALTDVTRDCGARRAELDAAAFARLPMIIRVDIIWAVLRRLGGPLGRIRFEHLRDAAGLAAATRNGKRLELPGRIVVCRTRQTISFERTMRGAELMHSND